MFYENAEGVNMNDTQIYDDKTTVVNINHIHVPARKEFMTLEELSEQIPFSKSKIMEMIASGELREEVHFIRTKRKLFFYFPEIVSLFKPKLAKG